MSDLSEIPEIPEIHFQTLIDALLDIDTPIKPRFLYRLSDLDDEDLSLFLETWPQLPLWRQKALLEDLQEMGIIDNLLSFESIGRSMVSDGDPHIRHLAVKILWEFDHRDLIPVFIQLLESDPDADVRAAAAIGLGQFVYLGELDLLPKEMMRELEDRLLLAIREDQTSLVQRRALESVSYSSRSEIADLIESAFASQDHEMIASALIAMGRSMDSRWENTVLSMLNNKLPIIRAEAARAAGELEIKDAISTLVELTEDSEENVRQAAIWALSEVGGDRARHTLENLFQEVEDVHEADFLETALENLAFTDGLEPFSLLDIPKENPEDELLEMLIAQETVRELQDNGGYNSDLEEVHGDPLDNAEYNDEGKDFQD